MRSGLQISRHGKIIEATRGDLPQPFPLHRNRLMHALSQLQLDGFEFRPHAVAAGLPLHVEASPAGPAADERNAKKVEGLRFAGPTLFASAGTVSKLSSSSPQLPASQPDVPPPLYTRPRPAQFITPTQLSAAQSILLKNKEKKYFHEAIYRHPYRHQAIAYENIGFFRLIGQRKTSPSIAGDDDRAVWGSRTANVPARTASYRFTARFAIRCKEFRLRHPITYSGISPSYRFATWGRCAPRMSRRW